MQNVFLVLGLVLATVNCGLLVMLFFKKRENKDAAGWAECLGAMEKGQERTERLVREEIAKNREETGKTSLQNREEVVKGLSAFSDSIQNRMTDISTLQKNQLDIFSKQLSSLTQVNEQKLELVRKVVEERLKSLQEENSQKLERMRETVDERLQSTLEKRLGESFRLVSDRLEKVHQGLGEMQSLASGVGDLKKVLTNVKTRGTWGEVQLGNLLEQILTPEQFERNVCTKKGSRDPVEFSIVLPGNEATVYLPIDAKFPITDYERLQEATERGDLTAIDEATKSLEARLKLEAKNIRDKYLDPPNTTDFGIMFLPTEGLYAEVLRRAGLCDLLRNDYRVIVAGPTTIAALLNSLQMGFRTLAVKKRASEVWLLLGAVKTEFTVFTEILEKTQKKLQEASNTIETARQKSTTITRKLRTVQDLPSAEPAKIETISEEQKQIDALFE